MNGFEQGVKSAILQIVFGLVISVIVSSFANSGLISPNYVLIFVLFNAIFTMISLFLVPFFGISYFSGWAFGVIIMFQSGVIGIIEIFLYLGIPLIGISIKYFRE